MGKRIKKSPLGWLKKFYKDRGKGSNIVRNVSFVSIGVICILSTQNSCSMTNDKNSFFEPAKQEGENKLKTTAKEQNREMELISFADMFFSGSKTEKDISNRLGTVFSEEVNNTVLLEPYDVGLYRQITLEFSDASNPDRFVNGVIFDYNSFVEISLPILEKTWSTFRTVPVNPDDFSFLSKRVNIAGQEFDGYISLEFQRGHNDTEVVTTHRVIFRRFEKK